MELELKAKHFDGTEFYETGNSNGTNPSCGCAIEKAAFELTKAEEINECVVRVYIDDKEYSHNGYLKEDFLKDKSKAASHNYDETVIRIIKLNPVLN